MGQSRAVPFYIFDIYMDICYDIHTDTIYIKRKEIFSVSIARTTIMASEKLMNRVAEHTAKTGEKLGDFYNRAILNQLEKDGDFNIRDEVEEELNGCEEEH